MKHQIDPTVDCVFKAILGREDNKNLLIHFLNAVLKPQGDDCIQDVTIVNPYNEREFQSDKLTIVDIKARDRRNRAYQVEIQLAAHDALAERMLYVWSSLYHASLKKGQSFEELQPVVAIWLLKESLFADIDAYHLPFAPYNRTHKRVLYSSPA